MPTSDIGILTMRWAARLLALLSVGVILLFIIGERANPFDFTSREWLLGLCFPLGLVAGLILGWRWPLAGGAVAVAALAAFYAVHWLISSVFPRGWAFLVLASPGFLFLAEGVASRLRSRATQRTTA